MNSIYFHKNSERLIRKHYEGDHCLLALGLDNIVLTVVNIEHIDSCLNYFPIGIKILGVIFAYNDNVYEDFDGLMEETLLKLKSHKDKLLNETQIGYFLIKEVLHVDKFEFEENKLVSLDDMSLSTDVQVNLINDKYLKDNLIFGYTNIEAVTLNDNNKKIFVLEDDKFPSTNIYSKIQMNNNELLLENINTEKDNESNDYILSFWTKLDLNNNNVEEINSFTHQFEFVLGFKNQNEYTCLSQIFVKSEQNQYTKFSDCFLVSNRQKSNLINLMHQTYIRLTNQIVKNEEQKVIYNQILYGCPLVYPNKSKIETFITITNFPTDRSLHKSYDYPNDNSLKLKSIKLFNPHLSLPTNFPSTSIFYHVKGLYEFHHYKQDGVNDKGWGCAYRSFQCLYSWFFHNNILDYTKYPPTPSILEMQKILVDVKDKDSSIIGSQKWIGAFEGHIILSEQLKIECKILFCTSGSEIKAKAREIANHFENVGSPIMIGGGQYAYTILGIHYDITNGNCQYLILDPHYEDKDEISVILKNNGVSWKTDSMFEKGNFYNMLLPQIPK